MAKFIKSVFAAILLPACVTGCSEALYPDQPENAVIVERGLFGVKVKVTNKSDTNAELQEGEYNTETKTLKLTGLRFVSAQSKNQEQLLQWMMAYGTQQQNATERRRVEWEGFNTTVNTVASAVTAAYPIIGDYLRGQNQVQILGKQNRGALVQAIAGAVGAHTNGTGPDPSPVLNQIEDKTLIDEARRTFPLAFEEPRFPTSSETPPP